MSAKEAAAYRRGIDDACDIIRKEIGDMTRDNGDNTGVYADGALHGLSAAALAVRELAPIPAETCDATANNDRCLYALAMRLRSACDGTGGGTPIEELQEIRDYLRARLDKWGHSRAPSEEAFRHFLACCLVESPL